MSDASDGNLGDWLPHKDSCKCDDCRLDRVLQECKNLKKENSALKAALLQAAMSLETIEEKAGRDEYLKSMIQVRGYAHSRSTVAREALVPTKATS